MNKAEKILQTRTKVRFQDCDPFNHLNNSKYIDYFINAREDQLLESYNLDIFKIVKKEKKAWVVADHRISYIAPAFAMENIQIDSQLISYSKKSIQIEMRMYSAKTQQLKAVIWTTYILFDLVTNRSTEHNQEFLSLFESILYPVKEKDFNNRIKIIKNAA